MLVTFWSGRQVCLFHAWEEWAGLDQEDYLSVLEYLLWVFTPLAIVFIVPFLIVILLYLSILFLHVYKVSKQCLHSQSHKQKDLQCLVIVCSSLHNVWDKNTMLVALLLDICICRTV